MSWYRRWAPYVPVAVRHARALKKIEKLRKKGVDIQPVEIEGRKIAHTFWGEAWCNHLASFSDYANRLPRGRTYVCNGSVCHLNIAQGQINAIVSGSDLYNVNVTIKSLPLKKWNGVKDRCAGQIGSLLELLQGRLSSQVMAVVTDRDAGLFPLPREVSLKCSCPDMAVMCKHVAAVLYGVGARLDTKPELLFLLRGVNHEELISTGAGVGAIAAKAASGRKRIADAALADVFGIEISQGETPPVPAPDSRAKLAKPVGTRKSETAAATPDVSLKTSAKKLQQQNGYLATGESVARLRAKFGMSRSEFACLLEVSAPTIAKWETTAGALRLQARTLRMWTAARALTKKQARRKVNNFNP